MGPLQMSRLPEKLPSHYIIKNARFFEQSFFAIEIKDQKILNTYNKEDLLPQIVSYDLNGQIILPGLIDSHAHVAMTFLRDVTHYHPEILEEFFFVRERSLSQELMAGLSYPYLLQGLRSGTTSFIDHYFYYKGTIDAFENLGLRAFIGESISNIGGTFPETGYDRWDANKEDIANWQYSSRIRPLICPHACDTITDDLLFDMLDFAKKNQLPFHLHAAQRPEEYAFCQKEYKMSPIEWLDHLGALGPNTQLAHCIYVDEQDLRLLKNTYIAFCPSSQILFEKLAPIEAFLKHKLKVTLASDCAASNDSANLWQEARLASLCIKDRIGSELKAQEIWQMLLTTPYSLYDKELGQLDAGFKADFVVIEPHLTQEPITDLATNLLFSADASQVQDVVVDGELILRDRLPTKISLEEMKMAHGEAIQILNSRF